MTDDDRLNDALHAFRDRTRAEALPDGPPLDVVERTLTALRAEGGGRSPGSRFRSRPPLHPGRWSPSMLSLIRVAALLVVTAGAASLVGLLGPNPLRASSALADALEHVREAKTMTYTMRFGDSPELFRVSRMEPGLVRTEMPGGSVSIMDRARGKTLILDTGDKMAVLLDAPPAGKDAGATEDQIDKLRAFRGDPEAVLGDKVIDGRKVRGYRISGGGWSSVVWVDTKTERPARLESQTRGSGDGLKTVICEGFDFDAPLDPALFSLEVPEGYSVQKVAVPVSKLPPTEKDLVDVLGEFARMSGGSFPDDLQMPTLMGVLKDIQMTKDGLDPKATAWIGKVGRGVGLVWAMPPAAGALYVGKGVKLGDADRPIFRYKPTGKATYRVIFGDLSVREVNADAIGK